MAEPAAASPPQSPINDAAARHQVYLLRYGNGVLQRILALLRRADDRAGNLLQQKLDKLTQLDLFEAPKPTWTTRRLQAVLDEVRALQAVTRDILGGRLRQELGELAVYETEFQTRMIDTALGGVSLDWVRPTPQVLRSAALANPFNGQHMKDWVEKVVADRRQNVLRAIREGYLIGEPTPAIVSRIRNDVIPGSYRDVTTVVRTATNHFASTARSQLYAENAHLIKAVVWVSTLDGRTSPICRARDGIEYPVDSGPRPPAHPNCRSTTAPVMKTWEELGVDDVPEAPAGTRPTVADDRTRAARERDFQAEARQAAGGRWGSMSRPERTAAIRKRRRAWQQEAISQVPATTTYSQWLRRQSAAFQDEVLGPTRGRAFRRGDYTLDKFVDMQSGRTYTLAELKMKEAA